PGAKATFVVTASATTPGSQSISATVTSPDTTPGTMLAGATINVTPRVPLFAVATDAGAPVAATVYAYNANGTARFGLTPYVGFTGAVAVAVGDVNGDGTPDVLTVAPVNGHVKVFDGKTGSQLPGLVGSFFAFPGFVGPVSVAAGDVNGDGFADII